MKTLYTIGATATGGRNGHVKATTEFWIWRFVIQKH